MRIRKRMHIRIRIHIHIRMRIRIRIRIRIHIRITSYIWSKTCQGQNITFFKKLKVEKLTECGGKGYLYFSNF